MYSKSWFEQHLSLGGKPYTLDDYQTEAVFDNHKNTLVTARAGSGKTRVIVAKIAYLIATHQARVNEIAAFMFNRTAAAEVNERIGAVEIDGVPLKDYCHIPEIKIASTFHKFALDITKLTGEQPQIISEAEYDRLVKSSTRKVVLEQKKKLSAQEYAETLQLVNSFIARAGQKYIGEKGLASLSRDVQEYIKAHEADEKYQYQIWLHRVCLAAYQEYLLSLNFPQIDFNLLMARAIRILEQSAFSGNSERKTFISNNTNLAKVSAKTSRYKYIMVDEYQDFSYLFFRMIQAIRQNCPAAHLFAVGDDWQAINRFAGSDVNYFINFAKFFPEDVTNIPLVMNYRSARRIVENANQYMLKNYDARAKKAIAFNKQRGKIIRQNPHRTRFDASDLDEDALGDARYLLALAEVCNLGLEKPRSPKHYAEAAQLLKSVTKIVKKHHRQPILLLHRHNFTSCLGVTLDNFLQALEIIIVEQRIMAAEDFRQRVKTLTMHRSKGLESEIVILLEVEREQVLGSHPHATIFELFGDTLTAEKADQQRLLYVAMTRAKERLYVLSRDKKCPV